MKLERFKRAERHLTLNGKTMPIAEWARILGIRKTTIVSRLHMLPKLSTEEILQVGKLIRRT